MFFQRFQNSKSFLICLPLLNSRNFCTNFVLVLDKVNNMLCLLTLFLNIRIKSNKTLIDQE